MLSGPGRRLRAHCSRTDKAPRRVVVEGKGTGPPSILVKRRARAPLPTETELEAVTNDWDETPSCSAQLVHAERLLAATGSLAPWQDALELLSHTLDLPIPALLAQPSKDLRLVDVRRYAGLVRRRAAGEALPRITGHVTFMGLDLAVGPADPVIPKCAERSAELALEWARHRPPGDLSAAELGTGCGACALALAALEPRFSHIYAVEESAAALETAAANGARYLLNLVISWVEADGLDVIPEAVDLIVCGQLGRSTWAGEASGAGWGDPAAGRSSEREMSEMPSWSLRLLQQAPVKLRPGGALIWGLDRAHERQALDLIDLAFPDAQVWVDPQAGGEVIAVVQLPGS